MWWLSFINLFATFILSFCVWEAGRFVARRWKGGVAYRYPPLSTEQLMLLPRAERSSC